MVKLNKYLVCPCGELEGSLINADSPMQAYLEYLADYGEGCDCEVYETEPSLPELVFEDIVDEWGGSNPELSPLEEPWSQYIGKDGLLAIQKAIDSAIADHCPKWYVTVGDPRVFRYRVNE